MLTASVKGMGASWGLPVLPRSRKPLPLPLSRTFAPVAVKMPLVQPPPRPMIFLFTSKPGASNSPLMYRWHHNFSLPPRPLPRWPSPEPAHASGAPDVGGGTLEAAAGTGALACGATTAASLAAASLARRLRAPPRARWRLGRAAEAALTSPHTSPVASSSLELSPDAQWQ